MYKILPSYSFVVLFVLSLNAERSLRGQRSQVLYIGLKAIAHPHTHPQFERAVHFAIFVFSVLPPPPDIYVSSKCHTESENIITKNEKQKQKNIKHTYTVESASSSRSK